MNLDNRLRACADFVTGEKVCDVGTDHGRLVAWLLKSGKCAYAIASDLNEKPLSAACATLERYGVSDRAEVILSDGLKNVSLAGVTDIIIAGMGGELIAEILAEHIRAGKEELSGVNLILQPMTKLLFLRDWLDENGFAVIGERTAEVRKRVYTILNAKFEAGLNQKGENTKMLTVKDVVDFIDKIAPLELTAKDDNAGLLVGGGDSEVKKIAVCLDITNKVINEAAQKGVNVIVAHHPVIYKPLRSVSAREPAGLALKNGMSCICFHTSLDIAEGGITDIMHDMLKEPLSLTNKLGYLEHVRGDAGYGLICGLAEPLEPKKVANILKSIFKCTVLRYVDGGKPIRKIAFCSGGGDWLATVAFKLGADAYICGDIRHHEFIAARNNGFSIYDAGHFHTEAIAVPYLKKRLSEEYPDIEVITAESCGDPVEYII